MKDPINSRKTQRKSKSAAVILIILGAILLSVAAYSFWMKHREPDLRQDKKTTFQVNDSVKSIAEGDTATLPQTEIEEIDFNPDLKMDRTLKSLSEEADNHSKKISEWLNITYEQREFDRDIDGSDYFSAQLKELDGDLGGLDMECDGCLTQKQFDKKWKNIFDLQFLGWNHLSFNGNDRPDVLQMKANYLGKLKDAYYYEMTFIDAENPKQEGWSPQNEGKIYKVEKNGKGYLVPGVFQKSTH